jgi:hypothetical protein
MRFGCVLPAVLSLLVASAVRAQLLEAPIAGKAIALAEGRVACGAASGGWVVEAGGRMLKPPASQDAIGQAVELKVAATPAECAHSNASVTLIATGHWPSFDPSSVVLAVDDGRIDARGKRLAGVALSWKSQDASGNDVCRDPRPDGGSERCTWTVSHEVSVDPAVGSFSWLPAGARSDPKAILFDLEGRRASHEEFALVPARVTLRQLFPADASVDLATGHGEVPLVHPEAVSSADCGALRCEMSNGKLVVRGASKLVSWLDIKVRLRPHVVLLKNDAVDTQLTAHIPVLHCPMSIISGPPLRHDDEAKVVLKLEGGCASDVAALRFVTDQSALKVLQTSKNDDASYVVLLLGDIVDDNVAITAFRGQTDAIALAVARAPTRTAPQVRASLELSGYPNLNFVPNNRSAVVHVSPAGDQQHFALLPIEGVYSVGEHGGKATIRGDPNAAGLTGLRFGVRADELPAGLDEVDLGVVSDPLQRSIHEANIPAPIGVSAETPAALIEMYCGGGPEPTERIEVGVTAHLSFALRDSCRIVFHRERLSPEYGTQKLNFEIDVLRPDGSTRGDAHVSEVVTFRAGPEPRLAWIHGIVDPFDRVVVRVSHEADEAHYMGAAEIKTGTAAAKWSAVLGSGHVRLYGTSTIPTGLYRFSNAANSGALSLNFGVISRLTWLDAEGHEGFMAAEGGILVMGVATPPNAISKHSPTAVGMVIGVGVGVPIANRSGPTEASIQLHAWFESDIAGDRGPGSAGRYAFIFGPSISIGNIGTNL